MTTAIAAVSGVVTIDATVPVRKETTIEPMLEGSSLVRTTMLSSAVKAPDTIEVRIPPIRTTAKTLHHRPSTSLRDRDSAFRPLMRSVRSTGTATVNETQR